MYHHDSVSARQIYDANVITAQQHSRGKPVTNRVPRWRSVLAKILTREPLPLSTDHELFAGLDRRHLARACDIFEIVDVETGASLGDQGATVDRFVTILEGRIGVAIDGVPQAILDGGSQFGALSLIDDEHPTHRASFDVLAPSRIAVVTADRFPSMLDELPTVADRIHVIADVRRAYLAGLAAASGGTATSSASVSSFPVHLRDLEGAPARRPVMQVQSRTSR